MTASDAAKKCTLWLGKEMPIRMTYGTLCSIVVVVALGVSMYLSVALKVEGNTRAVQRFDAKLDRVESGMQALVLEWRSDEKVNRQRFEAINNYMTVHVAGLNARMDGQGREIDLIQARLAQDLEIRRRVP